MSAITTTSERPGEHDPSPAIAYLTARARNALETTEGRSSISSRSALSEAERQALTRREDELRIGLTPAEAAEAGAEVLRLMAGYPNLRLTHEEAARTAATFVAALAGLPLWAIRRACLDWSRGRVPAANPAFAPSAPELRIAADAVVRPRMHEASTLRTILDARTEIPPTDAEREAAIRYWQDELRPVLTRAQAPTAPERGPGREAAPATDAASAEAGLRARERNAQLEANRRVRDRELRAHGITDGRPMTVDMRRKVGVGVGPSTGDSAAYQPEPSTSLEA